MAFNILKQFGLTDFIGIYNTYLNNKQLRNDLNNKQLAELLLQCTQAILDKLNEQDEYLYGNVVKGSKTHIIERIGGNSSMMLVSQIVDDMKEELDGTCHYYKMAVKLKDTYPELAKKYFEMAKNERTHTLALHQMGEDLVNKIRSEMKTEVADYMEDYYEEAHDYFIDKFKYISYLIDTFNM